MYILVFMHRFWFNKIGNSIQESDTEGKVIEEQMATPVLGDFSLIIDACLIYMQTVSLCYCEALLYFLCTLGLD